MEAKCGDRYIVKNKIQVFKAKELSIVVAEVRFLLLLY